MKKQIVRIAAGGKVRLPDPGATGDRASKCQGTLLPNQTE
jgi:hypothetical protein